MAVSGAPVKMVRHAEPMSAMALDMLEAVKVIKSPANNKPMTVTVGNEREISFCCVIFPLVKSPIFTTAFVIVSWVVYFTRFALWTRGSGFSGRENSSILLVWRHSQHRLPTKNSSSGMLYSSRDRSFLGLTTFSRFDFFQIRSIRYTLQFLSAYMYVLNFALTSVKLNKKLRS